MKQLFLLSFVVLIANMKAQNCQHKHHGGFNFERAEAERSDTINIINTDVFIDLTDLEGDDISATTTLEFMSLQSDVHSLSVDLLLLTVDSILFNSNNCSYSYNDSLLIIDLDSILIQNSSYSIEIYYHGKPHQDPSGWGGWYSTGNYAYNLGVGFADAPHSYGRIWHPCFDNFVERSTYDFHVLSANGKTSYCSGDRIGVDSLAGDTLLTHWSLDKEIPAYLASISVAPYVHYEREYISITGDTIPIWVAAIESDTTNVASSFQNLNTCMYAFEKAYGPYEWNRVGYHLVPFTGGAMEHATNISYPINAISGGSLGSETLMAHELAHHWFGNLITCESAGEMWINEGMASFSERIFLEEMYGVEAYKNAVKANHFDVIRSAHLSDGSFLTISDVPHESTYGDHSYNKGADLAHTLRGYVGDSLFFEGLTYLLQNNQLSDVSSEEFRDEMSMVDGVEVDDFFNDWIFNPGFPQFSVDSFFTTGNGPFEIEVFVSHKLRVSPDYYSNVPIEISLLNSEKLQHDEKVIMNGSSMSFSFSSDFIPDLVTMDLNEKISQAITSDSITISSIGTYDLENAMIDVEVISTGGEDFLRVEEMWVGPSVESFDDDYVVNKTRYWRLDGFLSNNFVASTKFNFDGRPNAGSHLDDSLFQYIGNGVSEHDIKLLYREGPGKEWEEFSNFSVQVMGSSTNGAGYINADSLKLGEYTFGYAMSDVSIKTTNQLDFVLFPNPTMETVRIKSDFTNYQYKIFTMEGREVLSGNYKSEINLTSLTTGVYLLKIYTELGSGNKRIIKL